MDQLVHADFGHIPCEIMIQIFNYLAHRDRKKSRLVSYRWNQILDDWGKYFVFHAKLTKRSLNSLLNTNLYVDRVTLQNMTSRLPTNPFPEIKESVLGWRNSKGNILKFLAGCQNTEALTVVKFSLGEITQTAIRKSLQTIVWNNLTQLKLTVILTRYKFERTKIHLENCTALLQLINIPNIRELELYFEAKYKEVHNREIGETRFQNLCLAMYKFLSSHANPMKIFKCSLGTSYPYKYNIPEIPETMKQSMTEELKLENCRMQLWGVGQVEFMVTPTLMGGSRMKSFELETVMPRKFKWLRPPSFVCVDTHVPTFDNNMSEIFALNGNSLQNVGLTYLPIVKYLWFKNCSSLQTVAASTSATRLNGAQLQANPRILTLDTQIFESSSKTLINVDISDFSSAIDLAWFENCLLLENLSIETSALLPVDDPPQENVLQPKPKYSSNLKNLSLASDFILVNNNTVNLQIQQLLNQNGQTLQQLTLGTADISLSTLYALKFLDLKGHLHEYTLNCTPNNFTCLTELRAYIFCDQNPNPIDWILQNMPNLEEISTLYRITIAILKKILSSSKVKKICFAYSLYYPNPVQAHETWEFCKRTPGLQFDEEFWGVDSQLLLVDRSVYIDE